MKSHDALYLFCLLIPAVLVSCSLNSSETATTNTVGSASIVDGSIVDADLSDEAEIATSKLAPGSSGDLLSTLASGAPTFQSSGAETLRNLAFSISLAANQLTVDLQTRALQTPSATDPITIAFRSATATSGNYALVETTTLVSVTVPQGATLGSINNISTPIYLYAISNVGVVELAVSGALFRDEGSLVTTTALSAASDSSLVMYSASARASVPFRLIGRVISTQTTAGDWNVAPSQLAVGPMISSNPESQTVVLITPTFANAWVDAGGAGAPLAYYRDNNRRVHLQGTMDTGACGSAAFTLPAGFRPAGELSFAVDSNGSYGKVLIAANGNVTPDATACDNAAFSLDGVSFRATQ